jgi:hypothetical protein
MIRAMRYLVAILFIAGCGPSTSSVPQDESPPAATETSGSEGAESQLPAADYGQPAESGAAEYLPPPYQADELQAALTPGTEIKYRGEIMGEVSIRELTVTAADDAGVTIRTRLLDTEGNLIVDQGEESDTWEAWTMAGFFEARNTTRKQATVEVPAGTLDTWLYEIDQGDGRVTRYHFDRNRPGPFVFMGIVNEDGSMPSKSELLSRTP